MLDTIIRFFQEGGTFMMPIATVLVVGLAIAIERSLYLAKVAKINAKALADLQPLLQRQDFDAIVKLSDESSVTKVITAGVKRYQQSSRREEIESAMEERVMEAVPRLEKRTPYLSTLANIATLLGLLGTIIGLIAAFSAVATAEPAEKASLLSQSISVAMNTTAFGLISAIPLLLCHAVIQTKTTEVVDKLEMVGVKLLNIISSSEGATKTRASD